MTPAEIAAGLSEEGRVVLEQVIQADRPYLARGLHADVRPGFVAVVDGPDGWPVCHCQIFDDAKRIADALNRTTSASELVSALLGPGDPEELAAYRGRFGWLEALICDLKANETAMKALSEEDPSASFEAMQEVEALIRDVRTALSKHREGQG